MRQMSINASNGTNSHNALEQEDVQFKLIETLQEAGINVSDIKKLQVSWN